MTTSDNKDLDTLSYISVLLKKYVSLNSKPTEETFPELPTLVIWTRFVLAIIYGLWISLGQHGPGRTPGTSLMLGLNFITFLPALYCNTFLGADSESYGTKIYFSGVVNAMALMLLIWIYFYTLEHEEEEMKISQILLSLAANQNAAAGAGDSAGDVAGGAGAGGSEPIVDTRLPLVEETEF